MRIQAMRANLATLVDEFRRHGRETAVVAHRGNRRYATTYGELAGIAGRFAAEMERRGVTAGDRVVLWGTNSAEWIGVFFGCLLRGVIAVPLDAAGTSEFAGRVIRDVRPKLIVGDPRLLETLKSREQRTGTGEQGAGSREQEAENGGWGTARAENDTGSPFADCLSLPGISALLPAEPLFTVSDRVHAETPFQIVFTSGTTSEPRGIVHTHRNILVTLAPIEREMAKYRRYERWVHPLRFLHSIPLSHVFGQFMGLWCPALLAAEVHFTEQFEPARVIGLIRRERISVLVAVPRMLHLLRAYLLGHFPALAAQLDASAGLAIWKRWWVFRRVHRALGWKFWAVLSGGATVTAELEAFWNRLGFALIQGYGMTETAALVTLNHPFHVAHGSIGKAMPGREVRIRGDGEILVRGEMLSGATWSGGRMQPREGEWLATGDLAEENDRGELRFLGRKSDVIVTGAGLNIHPADLEAALAAQPAVRASVVVPCQTAGNTEPVAVVLFSGSDAELQSCVTNANQTLAEYQRIRRILRWPEFQFPYTSTGKLLRRQVAQWACATLHNRQASGAAPSGAAEQDILLALIAEVTGEPVPTSSDQAANNRLRLSEDLLLDSLGRVQLQSALEQRFAIDLEDDELAGIESVADLRALIERQLNRANVGAGASTHTDSTDRKPFAQTTDGQKVAGDGQLAKDARQPVDPGHIYPRWPWSWPVQALRVTFLELILRPLVWLLAAPRVVVAAGNGRVAELPDSPVLIIANHVTAYDGALILYALPARLRRRVAAAMSGEMLLDMRSARNQAIPLTNWLAPAAYWLLTALFNVFPLPRARGFRRSFEHAGEAMDRGYSVLLFPEGTRSRDGKLNRFRPGIGLLAGQSRVPIVPMALVGLGEIRAEHARWFRSGRIEIRIGQPIPVAPESDPGSSDPAGITAALEEAVRSLLYPPLQ